MWRCLAVLCVVLFVPLPSPAAGAVSYHVPVKGVVVDPFRPPVSPYGPGNRGWEFHVDSNTAVFAPADGRVTFAGQVGGVLNVVIQHDDGVRTTLRKLSRIDVKAGDMVTAGEQIGTASGEFYFGARCGDAYVDPAKLFNDPVHLVDIDGVLHGSPPFSCTGQAITAEQQAWLAAAAVASTVQSLR
jgi:murein DD-endopeptidase MepM/ murein hydrolase activator NlpD